MIAHYQVQITIAIHITQCDRNAIVFLGSNGVTGIKHTITVIAIKHIGATGTDH